MYACMHGMHMFIQTVVGVGSKQYNEHTLQSVTKHLSRNLLLAVIRLFNPYVKKHVVVLFLILTANGTVFLTYLLIYPMQSSRQLHILTIHYNNLAGY